MILRLAADLMAAFHTVSVISAQGILAIHLYYFH